MKSPFTSSTILVTGGASGIGLALAERLLKEGSQVIICGRRKEKLQEIQVKHPQIHIFPCDVSREDERVKLFQWATAKFPSLNVLVNNAGIQNRIELAQNKAWAEVEPEIAINFEAPIHLSMLFITHLLKQKDPAIINVTSRLSFSPLAAVPVYSATKAAFHSFTLSLRHQLAKTAVKVIEIIPPAVNTDLGGVGLHNFGVPLNEFADAVTARLLHGDLEISYGPAEKWSKASREELNQAFIQLNSRP